MKPQVCLSSNVTFSEISLKFSEKIIKLESPLKSSWSSIIVHMLQAFCSPSDKNGSIFLCLAKYSFVNVILSSAFFITLKLFPINVYCWYHLSSQNNNSYCLIIIITNCINIIAVVHLWPLNPEVLLITIYSYHPLINMNNLIIRKNGLKSN